MPPSLATDPSRLASKEYRQCDFSGCGHLSREADAIFAATASMGRRGRISLPSRLLAGEPCRFRRCHPARCRDFRCRRGWNQRLRHVFPRRRSPGGAERPLSTSRAYLVTMEVRWDVSFRYSQTAKGRAVSEPALYERIAYPAILKSTVSSVATLRRSSTWSRIPPADPMALCSK